ncbi:hypothetical protein A3A66_01735 [Microgenomates group bacterium RIFCSPLOWO2_01_FULL_46_13]|nr:MAG: hypothetical protein A2783_00670 [Microgenomates group bacterium RIFCSPHIGHO2_01_FULL_45_11]OGV94710.1 MAG: hypothetical protein A3A66_01735 [Microgenomates group bacterium RIFCSPLOWO2_01_FULL_46_13]
MRLFGLLIGVLILALLLVYSLERFTLPSFTRSQDAIINTNKVVDQVEQYKQDLNQKETEILDQVNQQNR